MNGNRFAGRTLILVLLFCSYLFLRKTLILCNVPYSFFYTFPYLLLPLFYCLFMRTAKILFASSVCAFLILIILYSSYYRRYQSFKRSFNHSTIFYNKAKNQKKQNNITSLDFSLL